MHTQSNLSFSTIALFAGTLFISASIMFVLQPMFGKILLPLLGGSPAVWNTCMVFYQAVLFLAYLYAHFICTRQNNFSQILIHTCIIIISFFALPLALPENTLPPTDADPTFWLLGILSLSIGLPFFVVSTTSPLLQKWFANIGHSTSHDPYYLYAASNVGSMLALLSYPFLLEPNLGLDEQKTYWVASYILLCTLILACAFLLWKARPPQKLATTAIKETTKPLTIRTRMYWFVLAFVPSSLLLGLTNFISTDIASVPLLWVIPLTLYLLTFIIVFSRLGSKIHSLMLKLQAMILLPFIAYSFINPAALPYWVDLILHGSTFFLTVMVCHGELAKHRPHTRYLTDFYLIMSCAGMIGGMFNTFVAPFIFDAVYEYPIMIIAALLLRPGLIKSQYNWQKQLLVDSIFPLIIFFFGLALYAGVAQLAQHLDTLGTVLILLTGLIYSFRKKPLSLALLTATIIFFILSLRGSLSNILLQERTFFGVISVRENILLNEQARPEKFHALYHGTTKHGAQRLPAKLRTTPLTYFSRPGPIGQFFAEYNNQNDNWKIAVVGLGAGTLSCYAKKNQQWKFYELDPNIVAIAQNPKYFTYLQQCSKNHAIVVGDARISIQKEADNSLDLLIIDAFSSDSIPTHLLTQEAFVLYFSKIKANGLLAFHITNRHLSLKKVISDHAKNMQFAALIQEFKPQTDKPLVIATDWVVMANNATTLQALKQSRLGQWQHMPLYFDMTTWTDDFTNIITIWKD